MNNLEIKVIMPIDKNKLENITIRHNINNQTIRNRNDYMSMLDFAIGINNKNKKISKKNKNKKYFNTNQTIKLINSKDFQVFESEGIFEDIWERGKIIFEQLQKVENEHNYQPKGIDHFEKTLNLYKSEIYSNKVDTLCYQICKDYCYEPITVNTKNPEENYYNFFNFMYETYELFILGNYISINQKTVSEQANIIKQYYDDELEFIANKKFYKYITKYQAYDKLYFNVIDLKQFDEDFETFQNLVDVIDDDIDKERYQMFITTEELIVPVIFQIKDLFCNTTKNCTYAICEECHNLYKKTSSIQKRCKRITCRKQWDRNRHNKLKSKQP